MTMNNLSQNPALAELQAAYDRLVDILALAAEYRDAAIGEHIDRIARYTTAVARELGVPAPQAEAMGKAARLHDVGNVGVPDHILSKPGRLDPEEFEAVKAHTRIGAALLARDPRLALAREIALGHHEQWGGQGYPDALRGAAIPLAARIVSVVDVYDALVHARPYKEPWSEAEALEFIALERGVRFDPEVVDAFQQVVKQTGQD